MGETPTMDAGKLIIAISSCWRYEQCGWNNALRDTWLRDAHDLGITHRFFHGRGEKPQSDIVVTDSYADYHSLMYKTLEKFKWVLANGYDSVFHCYHDTYACAERLRLPEGVDYFGDFYHEDPRQPWPHLSYGKFCQSGAGVLLSRKALQVAVGGMVARLKTNPSYWEEDVCTGESILNAPELTVKDSRDMPCNLTQHDHGPRRSNNMISCHLSTIQPDGHWNGQGRETEWKYRPEFMYKLHREWQTS